MLGEFDFILSDPPYGISYDSSHKKYKNGIDRGEALWDTEPFNPQHLLAFNVPILLWGGNCFASKLPDSPGWLCWVKTANNGAKIRQADMELAWTNFIKRPVVFRHVWIGAYRESESGIKNVHPTKKPQAVIQWCLSLNKKATYTVDPYFGSGTLGVVCERVGMRWAGIEISEEYCKIAKSRIEKELSQKKLPGF